MSGAARSIVSKAVPRPAAAKVACEQVAQELYGIGMEYVAKRFLPVGVVLSRARM